MYKITDIFAREILNSQGEPTIEVVISDGVSTVTASVPTGASTGASEACELRDNDASRYAGKGVLKAIANVNGVIKQALVGNWDSLVEIDNRLINLDGTENKRRLGANAILATSLACARLFAVQEKKPLYKFLRDHFVFDHCPWKMPVPLANVINGGVHANDSLDVQEFWLIPSGIKSYFEQLRAVAEVFHVLGNNLHADGYSVNVGAEGGYTPNLDKVDDAWHYLEKAVAGANYELGKQMFFGFDAGASVWQKSGNKDYYWSKQGIEFTAEQLKEKYISWFGRWPFVACEDPFGQEDWTAWQEFTTTLKHTNPGLSVIGDDLFTTKVERLKKGVELGAANSVLIKPNQIGTLSETIACIRLAQDNKWKVVISHRSGETNDDFVADLAVAVAADYVKFGAPSRSERLAKYNRLLVIESEIQKLNQIT